MYCTIVWCGNIYKTTSINLSPTVISKPEYESGNYWRQCDKIGKSVVPNSTRCCGNLPPSIHGVCDLYSQLYAFEN